MAEQVFYNNTEENDDWMKALPGYRENEKKLHDLLAKNGPSPKSEKKEKTSPRRSAPRWDRS